MLKLYEKTILIIYILHQNTIPVYLPDRETKFSGHCLGRPEERNPLPAAERSLNPAACSIVRAIMHSALVYVSCNSKTATKGLLGMVKVEGIDRNELPEFFWGHLEQDIKILAQAIGKNEEEAAIVLHLVLQQILTCEPPKSKANNAQLHLLYLTVRLCSWSRSDCGRSGDSLHEE